MPSGIQLHTTETCVPSFEDQDSFLRGMWRIHRILSIPTMVWCELRDGTAGTQGLYAYPYGLVKVDYTPKPSYYTAKTLVESAQ